MPSYHKANSDFQMAVTIMIKRTSLVWKRPQLSAAEFRELWLGEHVEYARKLAGLREYVIDFATEAPKGAPSGIATLRFDTREALESAFIVSDLKQGLFRTRDQFADVVQVLYVDEHVVVPRTAGTYK
jgi:uncharacterized protein (TIGR02118 family)